MKTSAKIFTAVSVIVVLGLIAAVIALAIGLYGMKMRADENARRVDYMYETALCESLDSVREAENDLAKMLVSAEGETLSLASDIRMSAGSAAARVANLPVDLYTYSGLEKFLNQVSDFMSGYIRAVESGKDAEEYNEQLESLYETILSVRKKLEEAANKLGGDYSIAEDINESGSFNIGEGDFNVEYPGIIYDGPFSDSRDTSWKALDDKAEIGESDALDVLNGGVGMTGRITCRSSGDADLYVAEGTAADGSSAYATVTVRGRHDSAVQRAPRRYGRGNIPGRGAEACARLCRKGGLYEVAFSRVVQLVGWRHNGDSRSRDKRRRVLSRPHQDKTACGRRRACGNRGVLVLRELP